MIVVQCSSCTARGFHPFSEASSSSPTHHTPPLLVFSTRTTRAIDPSRKQRLVTSISLFKMSFYDFHFAALASEVPKPSPAAVDTSSSAHNSSPPAETSSEESPSASSQSFAPEATAAPETPAPFAMAHQPQPNEQQVTGAERLAQAIEAIHPTAKAIPSLRRTVEKYLRQLAWRKFRTWSDSRWRSDTVKWKKLEDGQKPPLVELVAALAAYDVFPHKTHTVFGTLVEHRKWREWAVEEMKRMAEVEGISLAQAQQQDEVKQELEEREAMLQTQECTPDLPASHEQEADSSQQSLKEPPQRLAPHSPQGSGPAPPHQTAPQSVAEPRRASVQQVAVNATQTSAQSQPRMCNFSTAVSNHVQDSSMVQQPNQPSTGSVLPLKRSIECPAGPSCPNPPKLVKTSNFGCQVSSKDINQAINPRKQRSVQPLPPLGVQAATPALEGRVRSDMNTPARAPLNNEHSLVAAVEKLTASNSELQQSNQALRHSLESTLHEMAAHGMYWQQRATMMHYHAHPHHAQTQAPGMVPYYVGNRVMVDPGRSVAGGPRGERSMLPDLRSEARSTGNQVRTLNRQGHQSRFFQNQ